MGKKVDTNWNGAANAGAKPRRMKIRFAAIDNSVRIRVVRIKLAIVPTHNGETK